MEADLQARLAIAQELVTNLVGACTAAKVPRNIIQPILDAATAKLAQLAQVPQPPLVPPVLLPKTS